MVGKEWYRQGRVWEQEERGEMYREAERCDKDKVGGGEATDEDTMNTECVG